MVDGKRLGIAFGLALGLDHGFGPPGRTAPGGAALYAGAGGLAENIEIVLTLVGGSPVSLASLLGLQDDAITLVAIDPAEALSAVAIVLEHAAFKHVIRTDEHTSELQSLTRISNAVFRVKKK